MPASDKKSFRDLIEIIAKLRDPNGGCPWDLEQTADSLKPYIIEEAYETVEAIGGDPRKLCEELGDLLLQVVLQAQIGSETKAFSIDDVVDAIATKLVKRHPHVFGDVKVQDSREVLKNWEENKRKEAPKKKKLLEGIPKGMPALLKAFRMGEKMAGVRFDWENVAGVRDQVLEELEEFLEAQREPVESAEKREHLEEELGDLLFCLAQYARKLGFNPEEVLFKACEKVTKRFGRMEDQLGERQMSSLSLEEMENLWERAKKM